MVYFVQDVHGGAIKIGSSIRAAERCRQLSEAKGLRLLILGVMDGGFDEERATQRRFNHLRLEPTPKCEWFRPEADLLEFIRCETRIWTPSDDAPSVTLDNIFVLRGTDEFKVWMDGLAAHIGAPVTVMVERAMRELARKESYPVPPRRVP
jgi:hypothetical protein